jgi:NADPH2:quinone reductase
VDAITESDSMQRQGVSSPCGGADECLLRVEAAGGNFLDTLIMRGHYQVKPGLPFTQGVAILTGEGA